MFPAGGRRGKKVSAGGLGAWRRAFGGGGGIGNVEGKNSGAGKVVDIEGFPMRGED